LKIVGIEDSDYIVFAHFFPDRKLIEVEDYQRRSIKEVDSSYMQIEALKTDGSFSPEKYLDKQKNEKVTGSEG